MKQTKYLVNSMLTLVLGGYMASCSNESDYYGSVVEEKLKAYEEVFSSEFGKIDPKQDWGFGSLAATGTGNGARAITRAITVNGDTYDVFNFPSQEELTAAFPTTIPAGAVEVSQLGSTYIGQTVQTQYGELTMTDLYAVYANKIVEGYNLKITQAGVTELGGNFQNTSWDEERGMSIAHPYNVYVYVDGNVTIRRVGATHFNLYILKGNVTLESDYGEQAGSISVAAGATLNDQRNSIAANQGIKLYNRGTVNATNTEKYDIGNFSTIYNEGKFYVSGPLTYSPGDANTSYFVNFGDDAEITAPAMTMNSSCHFYNSGKVTVSGETFVTQARINWINNGFYKTGAMTFSAKNNTFYNYCQLIVEGNAHMYDGEFNLMRNSYTEAGTAGMDNFIVNMASNTGMYIKGDVRMIAQGDATFQGFRTTGSNDYLLIDGKVTVDAHYHTFSVTPGITYSVNEIEILKGEQVVTDEYLQSINDGAYPVLDLNGTECPYGKLTVTPNTNSCGASWVVDGTPRTPDTDNIPIVEGSTGDDIQQIDTLKEYFETKQLIQQGRVFCEDLGQVSSNDLDFNDVVFDAYIYEITTTLKQTVYVNGELTETLDDVIVDTKRRAHIILLAAGGTLQLTVANKEVHNMFNRTSTTIINTIDSDEGSYGNNYNTTPLAPVDLGDDFEYSSIAAIPIIVNYGSEVLELNSNLGEAPHKILVPIGTKWPKERVKLKDTYTQFADYVNDSSVKFWNGEKVQSNLFILESDTYEELPMEPSEPVKVKEVHGYGSINNGSVYTGGYEGTEVLSRKR